MMGYQNPVADTRFFSSSTAQRQFEVQLSIAGDFTQTIAQVQVSVRYAGKTIGTPYIYTGNAAHPFKAPWSGEDGVNFEVMYTVSYLDGSKPPVTSPWINQRGASVDLIVPEPA